MVKKKKIENVADAGEVGQVANAESFGNETWSKFPNLLLANPKYSGNKLSNDAKILYFLFRHAFDLAVENKQLDTNGKPYFYYGIEKMELMLGKSRKVCTQAKKDLVNIGLVYPDPDSGHFDPRRKANTPKRYYLLVPDYNTFGDTLKAKSSKAKSSKALSDMDSPKGNSDNLDDVNTKNGDRSPITPNSKNPKNLNNGSKALGDMDSPKGNSDNLDDENLRSLDATAPLEKNENSKSSKALSDMDSPKGNSDNLNDGNAKNGDRSTFSKNENFNHVPSALQPHGQSKYELNIDRYIDYLSMLDNSNNFFNSSLVLFTNTYSYYFNYFNYFNNNHYKYFNGLKVVKDYSNKSLKALLNNDIGNTLNAGAPPYNYLSPEDFDVLGKWLNDIDKADAMANSINWAIYQAYRDGDSTQKWVFNTYKGLILNQITGLLKWCVRRIEKPKPKETPVDDANNYVFKTVNHKVEYYLRNPNKLTNKGHDNRRVEKGTDWSKKKVDTNSGITTAKLKELFKDLNNK